MYSKIKPGSGKRNRGERSVTREVNGRGDRGFSVAREEQIIAKESREVKSLSRVHRWGLSPWPRKTVGEREHALSPPVAAL